MTTVYEGDSESPLKMSGKMILAEMASRTDPTHWETMERLRDACVHALYPTVLNDAGEQMCVGCSRTKQQAAERRAELTRVVALKEKPSWTTADFKAWQASSGGG
jgi:hypothetical protein